MSSTNEGRTDTNGAGPSDSAQRNAALTNHRIQFEDANNHSAERFQTARKNDIIFGRGKGFQRHPGNQRMREIIDRYKEQYQSLERARKRNLVEAVYNEIVEGGARFLTKSLDDDTFFVVDVPTALQKVSNTLRCKKSLNREVTTETAQEHFREPSNGHDQKEARAQSALRVDNSTPYAVARAGIPSMESLFIRRDQALPLNPGLPVSSGLRLPMSSGLRLGHASVPSGLRLGHASVSSGLGLGQVSVSSGLGLGHASLPLNLGARPVSEAMEAPRFAATNRYSTLGGIPGMPLGLTNALVQPSSIEYYNILRQDQLMRDIHLLQQMGNGQRLNVGSLPRTTLPQSIMNVGSLPRTTSPQSIMNAGSLWRRISPQSTINASFLARRLRNPNELPPSDHRDHNEPRRNDP
jgi:hypothetical protein